MTKASDIKRMDEEAVALILEGLQELDTMEASKLHGEILYCDALFLRFPLKQKGRK